MGTIPPNGVRTMNIAFASLFSVLALLLLGATALHIHNSIEIDKLLSKHGTEGLLTYQADIAGR